MTTLPEIAPGVSTNREAARQVLEYFKQRWPRAFCEPPKPLKRGIGKDIAAALGRSFPNRALRFALSTWCRSRRYRQAHVEGAVRVDLEGAPAGIVTAEDFAAVREKLRAMQKNTERRNEGRKADAIRQAAAAASRDQSKESTGDAATKPTDAAPTRKRPILTLPSKRAKPA
jgi:ProP effector